MEQDKNKGLTVVPQLAQLDHIEFTNQLSNAILEGTVDPLTVQIFLKRIEAIQKALKDNKNIKEVTLKEASKHAVDGNDFSFMGAKVLIGAVHTAYDFSSCGDILWDNLNEVFNQVKEMKEEREAFLKAAFPEKTSKFGFHSAPTVVVQHTYNLVQNDCGEEITLSAPIKKQQLGLKITLPKK